MSKRRALSEGKKFLVVLVVLVAAATPVGQHAYMGIAKFFSKIVAGSIVHSIPKLPNVTPSSGTSTSK